jgi:hypothetical protein
MKTMKIEMYLEGITVEKMKGLGVPKLWARPLFVGA